VDYPHFLTREWEEAYRARRIERLIRRRLDDDSTAYTVQDAETMLMDGFSLAALELVPLMTAIDSDDAVAKQALTLLRAWNGAMDREWPEPLIFTAWLRYLNHALHADELGPMSDDFAGLHPRVVAVMLKQNSAWCDDVTTKDITEICSEVLNRSLQTALNELSATYGADITRWRWGNAHRAVFPHPLLSRIPLLKDIFDIGIETDGGNYTVNRGAIYAGLIDDESRENPYDHRHGPGLRVVYDLADLDNSRFMIPTGQSGNPLSPYYDNFVRRWRDGEFVSLRGDREVLASSALGILDFRP
jgi:penicillin amidase